MLRAGVNNNVWFANRNHMGGDRSQTCNNTRRFQWENESQLPAGRSEPSSGGTLHPQLQEMLGARYREAEQLSPIECPSLAWNTNTLYGHVRERGFFVLWDLSKRYRNTYKNVLGKVHIDCAVMPVVVKSLFQKLKKHYKISPKGLWLISKIMTSQSFP